MLVHNSEDVFNPDKAPEMMKELSAINKGTAHIPVYFKAEIIISYLKNHSLKNEWIVANPKLADIMINGYFKTKYIESLFEYCRMNQSFTHSYENYIQQQVLTNV
jgi:hypothetical protein